ncbi:VOC family protein [Pseudoalteromonas luteoviolacea]|uniref:VOC family protein n=1 Tax=Pseudoalteromonas luteoviolacea TaxID=43657 RepID=UPI001B36ACFC|nr:VOC family protein [Pseudoalteromonas luteoviolacea]MBQ4814330.1 VOC family protein [Pseudoalteromonas luteoviolacea]
MITGVNHITLSVTDLLRSMEFYQNLGAKLHVSWQSGAYLSLGDLWLCLSLHHNPKSSINTESDYSHLALNIEAKDFRGYCDKIAALNIQYWKQNTSEGDSLYILDPDRHKLEIHVGSLQSRLESLKANPYKRLTWYPDDEWT